MSPQGFLWGHIKVKGEGTQRPAAEEWRAAIERDAHKHRTKATILDAYDSVAALVLVQALLLRKQWNRKHRESLRSVFLPILGPQRPWMPGLWPFGTGHLIL